MTRRGITVGVDGSPGSIRALDRAAEEASLRATTLDIVYAVADLDEAGPILSSAVARVRARHPGLPVTALAIEGRAAPVLAVRARHAALTVVGCRGLGTLAGPLLGSVSRRLASLTTGPLLIVRGSLAVGPYSEELLEPSATDLGPASAHRNAAGPTGSGNRAVQTHGRGPSASGATPAGRAQ
ncbi:universal stress protein [Streptomyces indicus]|uniref:Nucleotide-binding universal stress protein, UspA family n=1 Tax=Streptomyces indicus TaxID=417292 RepID=A0A1G8ZV89_9ACTN|nr:universal stress protein [Streptomyces indicus]SDK18901.1 Nucleotide-binding universal stress protein, UspA family [Streptomyces indicus]